MTEQRRVPRIIVRREIAASADELFDAWLDADGLVQWMRPLDCTHSTAKVKATVGGAFEIIMHSRSQGPVLHRGVYKVIDRPRRLVFTWNSPATYHLETLVTVDFRVVKSGTTEVVITHESLPDAEAERNHTQGWSDILKVLSETRLS